MTIQTTVSALQSLHAGITGVTSAPVALPITIDPRRLPLVFSWPGPTAPDGWAGNAGDWYRVRRTYVVRCYVAEVTADGSTQDDAGYQAASLLLQRFGVAYMEDPNIGGAVAHIGPVLDSGVAILDYGGKDYHGFEFRLDITEKVAL